MSKSKSILELRDEFDYPQDYFSLGLSSHAGSYVSKERYEKLEKELKMVLEIGVEGQRRINDKQYQEKLELLKKVKEHLPFLLDAAKYVYGNREKLQPGWDPTFYHTLTYEGDLELIGRVEKAEKFFEGIK